jgi:hypothetical protein
LPDAIHKSPFAVLAGLVPEILFPILSLEDVLLAAAINFPDIASPDLFT